MDTFASSDHRIKLRNHGSNFSDSSKFPPCQFVNKMTKNVIIFLHPFGLLDRKLEFALHFSQEKIVDDNVICLLIEFVLDSDQFKFILHAGLIVQKIDCPQETDKTVFAAFVFSSHDVAHSENNQIKILLSFACQHIFSCLQKMVNHEGGVLHHQIGYDCVYFR